MNDTVRVRMAPSPTGNLHLGTAYTTFFNFLFAKRFEGIFILRIEDTDQERNTKEYEHSILEGLKWLGLQWDEGPYYQIQRLTAYKAAVDQLVADGKAYYCFCTSEQLEDDRKKQQQQKQPIVYSGRCRDLSKDQVDKQIQEGKKFAIRLKVPKDRGVIEFDDILHGRVTFDSKLIGDIVLMRSNGIPLYNFAVVVDDVDMSISHVLRGDDHLSNTPKQILIFEALSAKLPQFAHWPPILNPDRIGKLSKRENATSVADYRKDGFLPEAIINYFALLGWTMPDNQEIMSLNEMEKVFDIKKMRLSGAAFDRVKLEWLNGEYIRKMSDTELTKRLEDFLVDHPAKDKIAQLVPLVKERIKTLSEFIPLTNFIFEKPEYDVAVFEKTKVTKILDTLIEVKDVFEKLPKPWKAQDFEQRFRDLAEELNIPAGNLFQLVRVTVSGQLVTPPLFETIVLIGEEEVMERIKFVVNKFESF